MEISEMNVQLRNMTLADLPTMYEYQLDAEANALAATHPRSAEAFDAHWNNVLQDTNIVAKVILADQSPAGHICCFQASGQEMVGYWIRRELWGQGIATQALSLLLTQVSKRPLHATVAATNPGSLRVLQKCGFVVIGYQQCAEDERYHACEEALLRLV